jgi:DNA polymerase elongation subunit (family B)
MEEVSFDNEIDAQYAYLSLKQKGKQPAISLVNGKYILTENSKFDESVKEIVDLGECDDYVYDIETDNGHFQAGIGEIVVHNTDSIFILFDVDEEDPKKALKMAIETGEEAGKRISESINSYPHNLEYEKTFQPFLLWNKKKYTGNLYETDINSFIKKSMGDAIVRRDYAKITKHIYAKVADCLLNDLDVNKAVKTLIDLIKDMFDDKFEIDQFILSKTLNSGYKNPLSIPHKVLADRVAVREPGNAFAINDRVPFVYIKLDGKKKKIGDNIEIPDYVIKNKLKVDYIYYLRSQVMNPVCSILELIVETPENIIETLIEEEIDKQNNAKGISQWLNIEEEKEDIVWEKKKEKKEEKGKKKQADIGQWF